MNEEIEFCAEIKHETEEDEEKMGAFLLTDGIHEWWVPKSQIISKYHVADNNYEFTIPEWLAIDKGII